jgi:hypothetical protein
MRTTIALDDNVLAFPRSEAQRQRISIGEAISRLARDGIRSRGAPLRQAMPVESKYALLPARDEIITTEHVRDLLDQEGI